MKHLKWLVPLFMVISLMAIVALVVHYGSAPDDATPAEVTGIEIDVDRAKPRPPLKTQPKAKVRGQ